MKRKSRRLRHEKKKDSNFYIARGKEKYIVILGFVVQWKSLIEWDATLLYNLRIGDKETYQGYIKSGSTPLARLACVLAQFEILNLRMLYVKDEQEKNKIIQAMNEICLLYTSDAADE